MRISSVLLLGLSVVGLVVPGAAHAVPTAVDFATVSMSAPGVPRTVTDTVCASDGNDLVCDRGVYITSSSRVGIGTAAPRSTLHVSGSARVWGSGEIGYAPFLVGAQNSNKYLYMQMVSASSVGLLGTYDADSPGAVMPFVINTRVLINTDGWAVTPSSTLQVSGSLRLAHETSASLAVCDANRTGAIRYTGGDFSFCRNGSTWETLTSLGGGGGLGDRIVSGTSAVVMNSATGIVSISQFGSVASYVHPSLGYVGPGVSTTGTVSGTSGYFGAIGIGTAPSLGEPFRVVINDNAALNPRFARHSDGIGGVAFTQFRSRGTENSPTALLYGDTVGGIAGFGFDGQEYREGAALRYFVDQAPSIGYMPVAIALQTGNYGDIAQNRLVISSAGLVGIGLGGSHISLTFPSATLHVSGTLRLASGGEACDVNRTGGIRYTGGDFSFCRNGSSWETLTSFAGGGSAADRIVSGTVAVVANQATEYVSVTGRLWVTGSANSAIFVSGSQPGTGYFSAGVPDVTGAFSEIAEVGDVVLRSGLGPEGYGAGLVLAARSQNSSIKFATGAPVGGHFERMRIVSTGLVGIATSQPSTTLDVQGTLRLANGAEGCDANRTGAIRYTGGDFSFCRNGLAWETLTSLGGGGGLGDRIVSGTSAVVMNSATGIVSITQLGAVASYVHPSLGFVGPGVSATGTVSGSKVATNVVKFSGATGTCATAADEGMFFYDTARRRLQVCSLRN